ncbi:HNH endonuclease [Microbacterium sp. A93]|uniref:HNH endonuclease n=1 Tax=Microbacterium sp. A93 TaxID=3450716 RepID=UPI003F421393
MAQRNDGTEVPHSEALQQWAAVAYEELKRVAGTYNKVISYAGLRTVLHEETGLTTGMLMQNWIGGVLEIAAQRAADANEPPLTSLCVRGDGTIGDGYMRAPKAVTPSSTSDVEQLAAEHRLLCYAAFATDMPADGGTPMLPPEVALRRRAQGADATSDAWLDELIATGELSARDPIPFRTHLEVAKLFGRSYKGHQTATFQLDESTEVWFPKMYPNGDWSNILSDDGEVITMQHIQGGKYGGVMETDPIREYVITFGHAKPAAGPRFYTFLGVFEGAPQLSDRTRWVHQRVAHTVYFDGEGDFSFTPNRSRPVQDDQVAEAADTDPQMVATYQKQLDARSYAVEDKHSTAKSRGSAQAVFAKAVKNNYGWECAVTGIKTRAFLVASHIVPWSEDQQIRLDPSNGICLSTFVDRAFDAGFLAITPEGRTAVRWDKIEGDPILKLELSKIDDVEIFKPSVAPPDPAKLARRVELGY